MDNFIDNEFHTVEIEQKIGYFFKNKALLEQAFTRSSYASEHMGTAYNEVLEFIGDSIIGIIVVKQLITHYQISSIPDEIKATLPFPIKQHFECELDEAELSKLKIDLVHVNAPFSMGMFGLDLAKKRKIPSITTFHSQFRQDFYKATNSELLSKIMSNIIIKVYDKSTVTLTMNNFSAKIMKSYGLKRNDVKIIPNATSLKYKEFDEVQEREVIEKHKIQKDKFRMLFIGRFVKVKNVYLILEVLKELFKINKNFQFIFLGYGPEEEKMKKIIRENNLEKNIVFTGKILDEDEKAIIIKNSNLLFFPSDYDTDGIVKIECACYSVPTLCLDNTGVSSGLVNNETGFVEKNNIENLVKKIDELSKNVDFVQKIGKNAKEKLYITWEDVGNKLLILYRDLMNRKNVKDW